MVTGASQRLERHLRSWLGAWPPEARLHLVGSARRVEPGWDGAVYPVAGVGCSEGLVLSVPPDAVDTLRGLGGDLTAVAAALPALVGRPQAHFASGIFRWCQHLIDLEPVGVWLDRADERVPEWLRPFGGDVLVYLDEEGRYGAGVGRKLHDEHGQELAVQTEAHLRGRGLGRALVVQAARRVAEEGAVATYLHDEANVASARLAEMAGFPDAGWRVYGLPVAS